MPGQSLDRIGVFLLALVFLTIGTSSALAYPERPHEIGGPVSIGGVLQTGPDASVVIRIEAGEYSAECTLGNCRTELPNSYYFSIPIETDPDVPDYANANDPIHIFVNGIEVEETSGGQLLVVIDGLTELPVNAVTPSNIPIPDVTGANEFEAAFGTLPGAGFTNINPTRPRECSDSIPLGSVTRTDPAADSEVPASTLITIYVSDGTACPIEDADGDGYNADVDCDDNDASEWADNDLDGLCDGIDTDDDGDGMPDLWEQQYGLDKWNDDAYSDLDGDRFSNLREYRQNTNPLDPDSHPVNTLPWICLLFQ